MKRIRDCEISIHVWCEGFDWLSDLDDFKKNKCDRKECWIKCLYVCLSVLGGGEHGSPLVLGPGVYEVVAWMIICLFFNGMLIC